MSSSNLVALAQAAPAPPALEKLTDREQALVSASQQGRKLRDLTPEQRLSMAEKLVKGAMFRLGHNSKNAAELSLLHNQIARDFAKFEGLTAAEIEMAVDAAIDGEFAGEEGVVVFSSANFCRWVKRWVDEKKRPTMAKWSQHVHQQPAELPPPGDDTLRQMVRFNLTEFAQRRAADPSFRLPAAAALWEDVERLGIATMTPERKAEIFAEVSAAHPEAHPEHLRNLCRTAAYNELVGLLAEQVDFHPAEAEPSV